MIDCGLTNPVRCDFRFSHADARAMIGPTDREAGEPLVPTVYVASSATLSKWAADVGLSKYVYKIGVAAEGKAKDAVSALNDEGFAGVTDWKPIAAREVDEADEDALIESLSRREKPVDPTYYPKIKGARGLIRVKLTNVENSMLVAKAMAGEVERDMKVKPADIGNYLIDNALG